MREPIASSPMIPPRCIAAITALLAIRLWRSDRLARIATDCWSRSQGARSPRVRRGACAPRLFLNTDRVTRLLAAEKPVAPLLVLSALDLGGAAPACRFLNPMLVLDLGHRYHCLDIVHCVSSFRPSRRLRSAVPSPLSGIIKGWGPAPGILFQGNCGWRRRHLGAVGVGRGGMARTSLRASVHVLPPRLLPR